MKWWLKKDDSQRIGQEVSKQSHRQWWLLVLSPICLAFGIFIGILWYASQTNVVLAFGACLFLVLSFLCGWRFFIGWGNITVIRHAKNKAINNPKMANTLVICAKSGTINTENVRAQADKIFFEEIKEPIGNLHHCRNNNKEYFVNLVDPNNTRTDFLLPDCQYCDPRSYGIACEVPAQREWFKLTGGLWPQLKIALLVIALIALIIGGVAVNS